VKGNANERVPSARLAVAIVAPTLDILGGQAIQADRLLRAWKGDSDIRAWLVPVNPRLRGALGRLAGIKYLRTVLTQQSYWPLLIRELRHADVVHIFSASYWSFLLAPLPAVVVARVLGKPIVMNYRSGEAPDHLRRSALSRAVLRAVDRNVVPSRFLQSVFAGFGIDSLVIRSSSGCGSHCAPTCCRHAISSRSTTSAAHSRHLRPCKPDIQMHGSLWSAPGVRSWRCVDWRQIFVCGTSNS
jgi:hypothetical protein